MNIENKIEGSSLLAQEFNQIPDELENVITNAGIEKSASNLSQVSQAISQIVADGNFYQASGTANAIVLSNISPRVAPANLTNGMVVRFRSFAENTEFVTVNVNNFGAKYITIDGQKIEGGKIVANRLYYLTYISDLDSFELFENTTIGVVERNMGELVYSSLPLNDNGLHLANGALLGTGKTYASFISYIASIVNIYPNLFTTEAVWQQTVAKYGACGKYVYDEEAGTVRLPKLTGLIEGTVDENALSELVEAGLPSMGASGSHSHSRGTQNITATGAMWENHSSNPFTGAFYKSAERGHAGLNGGLDSDNYCMNFDASRSWTGKSSVEGSHTHTIGNLLGKSNTVQPQTIKQYIYIAVSTTTSTSRVQGAFIYRGSVETFDDLPKVGNLIGDVWNVNEDDTNYCWNGEAWDNLGGTVDLSEYLKISDANDTFATQNSLASNFDYLQGVVRSTESSLSNKDIQLQNMIAQNTTDIASLSAGQTVKAGLDKIVNSRAVIQKGEVSYDTDIYPDIAEMNRSSFDLSKFTVVGSPIITEDGVASGFSSSSYIKQNISLQGVYTLKGEITIGTINEQNIPLGINANNTLLLSLRVDSSNSRIVLVAKNTSGNNTTLYTSNNFIASGNKYSFEIVVNGSSLTFKLNNSIVGTMSNFDNIETQFITLGVDRSFNFPFTGSIDLKQFSITVYGKEVFNGNKTGLDVIKEDNYTIVGSPVVSEDGIASGFSSSDFIRLGQEGLLTNANTWEIEFDFDATDFPDNTVGTLFQNIQTSPTYSGLVMQARNYIITLYGGSGTGTTWDVLNSITVPIQYKAFNKIRLGYNGTKYYCFVNGVEKWSSISDVKIVFPNVYCVVGFHNWWASLQYGSIDLNAFKIYVDGQLVYQSRLKIPYNLSKNGVKIVPAYARDRVQDVYEQYGKEYSYYTIDEENKNFTLPIGNDYDNSARPSLENVNERGNEKLATSLMYETGKVSNDEKGFNQLAKMNKSTFDLSKFTVVGTPTITEDGVASGFSEGNYITVMDVKDLKDKSWTIKTNFINKGITTPIYSNTLFKMGTWSGWGGILVVLDHARPRINFTARTGDAGDANNEGTWANKNLDFIPEQIGASMSFDITTGTYTAKVDFGEGEQIIGTYIPTTENKQLYYINVAEANSLRLQVGSGSDKSHNHNATDLKQFSITVDGKEVFNGHKTGLDVIKEDNYTVVGSPVISDDGVASGFSKGNLIEIPAFIHNNKTWKIKLDFIPNNSDGYLFCAGKDIGLVRGVRLRCSNTSLILGLSFDGSALSKSSTFNVTLKNFEKYNVEVEYTGEQYNVYLNGAVIGSILDSTAIWSDANDKFYIGTWKDNTGFLEPFSGSIDLNSFKIYVDDELVYQPCLKIPYNVSKTGSKIVPAYARERVIDLYEQEGHAGYYTIDEEKKNFTLPMGEIYGTVEKAKEYAKDASFPSGKYVDLTFGATDTQYTAPANGWFYINKTSGTNNHTYVQLFNVTKDYMFMSNNITSVNTVHALVLPVSKNDIIKVRYNAEGATNQFRFYYAQGEV